MKNKTKRILLVIILAIVAILMTVFLYSPKESQNDNNSTTNTTEPTDQKYNYSQEQKQTIAEQTSSGAFSAISTEISTQLTEEQTQAIQVTSDVLAEDPDGKPAIITIIVLSNINENFDYTQNAKFIVDAMEKSNNPEQSIWQHKATESDFFSETGTVKALKFWDDREDPYNPAFLEISYANNTADDGTLTYDIYISSSVY